MYMNFEAGECDALAHGGAPRFSSAAIIDGSQGIMTLSDDELALIYGGDVDWGAVGNQALGGAITGGVGGAAGGAAVGAMAGGVGAGPGAVTGGIAGFIGGGIAGAGMELWNQLTSEDSE